MQNITKALGKASVATVAAGAMAVSSAAPAAARDRDRGIDAGDVIAGAVILGGIAAVISASSNNRDNYRYDRGTRYDRNDRNYRGNYRRGGNGRQAVERCVRAAERYASRYSNGRGDVTNVYDVKRKNDGWKVKGNMVVKGQRYGRYNRGGYDEGKFTCEIRYGQIDKLKVKGIRGL